MPSVLAHASSSSALLGRPSENVLESLAIAPKSLTPSNSNSTKTLESSMNTFVLPSPLQASVLSLPLQSPTTLVEIFVPSFLSMLPLVGDLIESCHVQSKTVNGHSLHSAKKHWCQEGRKKISACLVAFALNFFLARVRAHLVS